MATDKLDQVVKGQPPPELSAAQVAQTARSSAHSPSSSISSVHDPRDSLPSSPPQIYLNLLILESSLRLQYLSLRARLRLHLLLLSVLSIWIAVFTYLLFFRPREDGIGVGGSVYWVVEGTEKLSWCGGMVTLCLFWGTGMYERGVRWPRKFVGTSNRGLRGFNMKIVVVKGSVLSELWGWLDMLDPLGWFRERRVNFQILPKDIEAGASKDHWNGHAARHGLIEEDIAPSGDVLKLLLLPKPFSPDFREGWETYRVEYWDKENTRRADLRKAVTARKRDVARHERGWLWWTGWRGFDNFRLFSSKSRRKMELERLTLREKPNAELLKEKRRQLRAESHSRSSSRSSTPGPPDGEVRPAQQRGRRGNTTTRGRPKKGSMHSSRLSATETLLDEEVEKRASMISLDSNSSVGGDSPMVSRFADEIKTEPGEI